MKNRKNIIHDIRGVAALEMALVLPIMLVFFFGMLEYNRAYFHFQKANKISSTIADMFTLFKPIPSITDKNVNEVAEDCNTIPLMITENRINAILNNQTNADGTNSIDPIEALSLPLDPERVVVHITAIAQDGDPDAGELPRVAWKYSYTRNPGLALVQTFDSEVGDPNGNGPGDLVDLQNLTGEPYTMFQNEVMVIVEAGVAYESIIGGGLNAFISGLQDGWIRSNSFYATRSYILDSDGNFERGIKHVWPDNNSLEAIYGVGTRTANQNGC